MRDANLRRGELVSAVSALALLVVLFSFAWYGVAGVPDLVEVAGSSGHPSLDHAALAAIERWHFRPAQSETGPVPYTVPLDIHFVGDGR